LNDAKSTPAKEECSREETTPRPDDETLHTQRFRQKTLPLAEGNRVFRSLRAHPTGES